MASRPPVILPYSQWPDALPLNAHESAYELWRAFVIMLYNGTDGHETTLRQFAPGALRGVLPQLIDSGEFFGVIEDLKRECVRNKVPLSNAVLAETCAASLRFGQALPPQVRRRLEPLVDELYAHLVRLDAEDDPAPADQWLGPRMVKSWGPVFGITSANGPGQRLKKLEAEGKARRVSRTSWEVLASALNAAQRDRFNRPRKAS